MNSLETNTAGGSEEELMGSQRGTRQIRYFHVRGSQVDAATAGGRESEDEFSWELDFLENYVQGLGEHFGMSRVTHGIIVEEERTVAFRFREKPTEEGEMKGLLVSRRLPHSDTLKRLKD